MRFIKTITTYLLKEFPHPLEEGEVLVLPCLMSKKKVIETHANIPENYSSWDLFKELKTCVSYERYK